MSYYERASLEGSSAIPVDHHQQEFIANDGTIFFESNDCQHHNVSLSIAQDEERLAKIVQPVDDDVLFQALHSIFAFGTEEVEARKTYIDDVNWVKLETDDDKKIVRFRFWDIDKFPSAPNKCLCFSLAYDTQHRFRYYAQKNVLKTWLIPEEAIKLMLTRYVENQSAKIQEFMKDC